MNSELLKLANYLESTLDTSERHAYTIKFSNSLFRKYSKIIAKAFDKHMDKIDWAEEDTLKISKKLYALLEDYFVPNAKGKRVAIRRLAAEMEYNRPGKARMEQWIHFWKVSVTRAAIDLLARNLLAHYYVFDMYAHNFSVSSRTIRNWRRKVTDALRYINVTFQRFETLDNRHKRIFLKFLKAPNLRAKAKVLEQGLGPSEEKMLPEATGSLVSYMKRHGVYRLPKVLRK